jgi:hypothetical protein
MKNKITTDSSLEKLKSIKVPKFEQSYKDLSNTDFTTLKSKGSNITDDSLKELLLDFNKYICTEEYWEKYGKAEATEQIDFYLLEKRSLTK